MQLRVKSLVAAAENLSLSPLLPAVAVAMIAIFTVSLAMAEPQGASQRLAAHTDTLATPQSVDTVRPTANDSITDAEAALFSARGPWPQYRDRYRFYHRYDRHKARRSQFNRFDDDN